jgi:hypothetical protein
MTCPGEQLRMFLACSPLCCLVADSALTDCRTFAYPVLVVVVGVPIFFQKRPVIFEINLARRVFYREPVRGVPDTFGGNEDGDLPGGPYTDAPVPGGGEIRGCSQSPGV